MDTEIVEVTEQLNHWCFGSVEDLQKQNYPQIQQDVALPGSPMTLGTPSGRLQHPSQSFNLTTRDSGFALSGTGQRSGKEIGSADLSTSGAPGLRHVTKPEPEASQDQSHTLRHIVSWPNGEEAPSLKMDPYHVPRKSIDICENMNERGWAQLEHGLSHPQSPPFSSKASSPYQSKSAPIQACVRFGSEPGTIPLHSCSPSPSSSSYSSHSSYSSSLGSHPTCHAVLHPPPPPPPPGIPSSSASNTGNYSSKGPDKGKYLPGGSRHRGNKHDRLHLLGSESLANSHGMGHISKHSTHRGKTRKSLSKWYNGKAKSFTSFVDFEALTTAQALRKSASKGFLEVTPPIEEGSEDESADELIAQLRAKSMPVTPGGGSLNLSRGEVGGGGGKHGFCGRELDEHCHHHWEARNSTDMSDACDASPRVVGIDREGRGPRNSWTAFPTVPEYSLYDSPIPNAPSQEDIVLPQNIFPRHSSGGSLSSLDMDTPRSQLRSDRTPRNSCPGIFPTVPTVPEDSHHWTHSEPPTHEVIFPISHGR